MTDPATDDYIQLPSTLPPTSGEFADRPDADAPDLTLRDMVRRAQTLMTTTRTEQSSSLFNWGMHALFAHLAEHRMSRATVHDALIETAARSLLWCGYLPQVVRDRSFFGLGILAYNMLDYSVADARGDPGFLDLLKSDIAHTTGGGKPNPGHRAELFDHVFGALHNRRLDLGFGLNVQAWSATLMFGYVYVAMGLLAEQSAEPLAPDGPVMRRFLAHFAKWHGLDQHKRVPVSAMQEGAPHAPHP
jgi:hypothetical protein